jgi:hypothetical protein
MIMCVPQPASVQIHSLLHARRHTEESFGLLSADSVVSVVSVLFWVVALPRRVTIMSDYGKLVKSWREPHVTISRWFYEKG